LIYLFLERSNGKEIARWGFLATSLCPLSIFFNGGFLFNTSLVVLCFIGSLYLVHIERYKSATLALAVAFLFKQIILFLVIPILMYIILKEVNNNELKFLYFKQIGIHVGIFIGVFIIGSVPWLFIAPDNYLQALFMSQQINFVPEFVSRQLTWPVHWYSFLVELQAPYLILYVLGFLNFTMFGVILIQITDFCLLIYWQQKNTLNWQKFLDLVVYTAILSHLFLPRGVYKYYFTLHVPLVVLWFCFNFNSSLSSSQQNKLLLTFLIFCLIILLLHRLFYLLLIWVIFFIMIKQSYTNNFVEGKGMLKISS
jgi:hypothetical protein